MNTEKFIQGVIHRMLSCIKEDIKYVESYPPGRKPLQKRIEIHRWYSNLSDADKEMVRRLINETHEGAIYSILMVLDHKAFVEGLGEKGRLELYYRAPNGDRVHLNPFGGENGKDLEYYFKVLRGNVDDRIKGDTNTP